MFLLKVKAREYFKGKQELYNAFMPLGFGWALFGSAARIFWRRWFQRFMPRVALPVERGGEEKAHLGSAAKS